MKSINDLLKIYYDQLDDNKQNVYSLIHNYMKDVGMPALQEWIMGEYSKCIQDWIEEEAFPLFEDKLKGECFGDIDYSINSNNNNIKLKTNNFR